MRYLILIVMLSLTGCVKYVNVPVYSCPTPPSLELPKLKSNTLSKESDTNTKLGAMVYDIINLKKFSEQCITVLKGYEQVIQNMPAQPNDKVQ